MIQPKTYLNIRDNSGASVVRCIKLLGHSRFNNASIGDIVVVSVRRVTKTIKLNTGDVKYALILRTKYPYCRKNGIVIKFHENSAILVSERFSPEALGSRIIGPVLYELKHKRMYKALFLGSTIV